MSSTILHILQRQLKKITKLSNKYIYIYLEYVIKKIFSDKTIWRDVLSFYLTWGYYMFLS